MSTSHRLEALNDHALLSQFGDLLRQDHEGNANLLRHIDAIDRRQLWAKLGYPSLFAFLVTRHHMSESTAGKRLGAARTARRFPVLFAMVARGELHLSGIHRLKAHLTPENHERVLAAAKHKTIRQIEELVARLAPQPDVPSTLRALPTRTRALAPAPASPAPTLSAESPAPTSPSASPAPTSASSAPPAPSALLASRPLPVPRRSPDPAPLSPGRYRLQVTLGENARNKLKRLQDLLAHQIPNGDPAAIVERALDALLTQVSKRKAGITHKPRAQKPKSKSTATTAVTATTTGTTATAPRTRYIRCAVRREVWLRDDGRCGFVGEDGHRCDETRGVEFAHRHPWGKGGPSSAINLGLRCQAHNAWEAERDYGASHMASKRARGPWNVREPVARYSVRRGPCATNRVVGSEEGSLSDARVLQTSLRVCVFGWNSASAKKKTLDRSTLRTNRTRRQERQTRPAERRGFNSGRLSWAHAKLPLHDSSHPGPPATLRPAPTAHGPAAARPCDRRARLSVERELRAPRVPRALW